MIYITKNMLQLEKHILSLKYKRFKYQLVFLVIEKPKQNRKQGFFCGVNSSG
jgi:hypothetical protein